MTLVADTKQHRNSIITMPTITHTHTHTFSDGQSVTKDCTMTFSSDDDPDLSREKESQFTHPRTGETHTHRFCLTKRSQNNKHTFTSDEKDGYESDDVERYRTY